MASLQAAARFFEIASCETTNRWCGSANGTEKLRIRSLINICSICKYIFHYKIPIMYKYLLLGLKSKDYNSRYIKKKKMAAD